MNINTNPIRGTTDFLPKDASVRERVREIIINSYRENGFLQIKTPILENLDLLLGSDGGDNLKLIFKTIKRGEKLDLSKPNLTERDIIEEGLRYDLTVPLVRYYSNNRENLTLPFKSIQIDDVFRAERPQRGRLRQFTQCDIDILGDPSRNAEIEVLLVCLKTLEKLSFKSLNLRINDKRITNQVLSFCGFKPEDYSTVAVSIDKFYKIGINGVLKEIEEKGFSKTQTSKLEQAIVGIDKLGLNGVVNFGVDEETKENLNKIIRIVGLTAPAGTNITYDFSIVRGQGYYTGTVFEIYTEGFSGAISGGGRYDTMVEKMLGEKVPAVGISIGFEPVTMLLKERNISFETRKKVAILYDRSNDDSFENVLKLKEKLILNYDTTIFARPKNMRNLLTKLKEVGYMYYINYGINESMTPLE